MARDIADIHGGNMKDIRSNDLTAIVAAAKLQGVSTAITNSSQLAITVDGSTYTFTFTLPNIPTSPGTFTGQGAAGNW
jgi:hypothetical protein